VQVILHSGQTIQFSRRFRDHQFWDWFFESEMKGLEFSGDGEVGFSFADSKFLVRPGTTDFYVFKEIFLRDVYGLAQMAGEFDTVVDLGGNVGMFTCAVLPRSRRVITVEPAPANFRQAVKNVTRNGGKESDVLPFAVSARSGESVTLHTFDHNPGMNSLSAQAFRHEDAQSDITVSTISLEDLLAGVSGDVDLLKCDIEGGEFDVFLAAPLAVLHRLKCIVMEVHVSANNPRSKMEAMIARIREAKLEVRCDITGKSNGAETWMLTAAVPSAMGTFAARNAA
jgi:FkbM family methyltransferase